MQNDSSRDSSPIVELRRYAHHPGRRDDLISLFEREFIEGQEDCGCEVIAHFRDLDNPDTFTWFRGFDSMESRKRMLTAFYEGPLWMANRDTANSTLTDSDNVWLLRPARTGSGIRAMRPRAPRGSAAVADEIVQVTVYTLKAEVADEFPGYFERSVRPALVAAGATPIAAFVTEHSENDYPRLPVRKGEHAFIWLAAFENAAQYDDYVGAIGASHEWRSRILPEMSEMFAAPAESWRLSPGARSPSLRSDA